MNLHKHQSCVLKQHSESFKIWSAIIRINTEGKSLILKLGPILDYEIGPWPEDFVGEKTSLKFIIH